MDRLGIEDSSEIAPKLLGYCSETALKAGNKLPVEWIGWHGALKLHRKLKFDDQCNEPINLI